MTTLTINDLQATDFWALRAAPLHAFDEPAWAAYYIQMAPFILHPDPSVRAGAVERLSMAVMRAERLPGHRRLPDERALRRLTWLIDQLTHAQHTYPDILPAFLNELRHHGDDEPFRSLLCEWLHRLKDQAVSIDI